MTKKEFINKISVISDDAEIIVERKKEGIYEEFPIEKIVFVNNQIEILI